MKTHTYKALAFLVLISPTLVWARIAELQGKSREELATVFTEQVAKYSANLDLKCAFDNAEESVAFDESQTDPDLKISFEEFVVKMASVGIETTAVGAYTEKYCFMNAKEAAALVAYTGSAYSSVNAALRSSDKELAQKFNLYVKYLNSALDKIRGHEGFVKRGSSFNISFIANHVDGAKVTYPYYLSTSIGGGFGGEIKYVIYSKNCKYIAKVSEYPHEEEVLCKAGTKFVVHYRQTDDFGNTQILMEEEDAGVAESKSEAAEYLPSYVPFDSSFEEKSVRFWFN